MATAARVFRSTRSLLTSLHAPQRLQNNARSLYWTAQRHTHPHAHGHAHSRAHAQPHAQSHAQFEPHGVHTVSVEDVPELLRQGRPYVDVRTPEEYAAGHPPGAANVPYMLRTARGMTKNSNFERQMREDFDPNNEIVLGCQSGSRSMAAAVDLSQQGFQDLAVLEGGFRAWVLAGLPVETSRPGAQ
ncbi:Senescence-associated protein [Klebsormidium nitens]|uniref:Senescence-associated protein n=1 Tax=Klebsormidium nitens TaxID=105231 RepID=A0A1Y1I6T3_KLENI|nr:Senescence-associated protein [Klebsormidium nitens]|eukprot:GAQ85129.1 Senescence-associated protein [Klebsormidium nitens]